MKKLVYLSIILFIVIGCSNQEKPSVEDVYVAPDSVWDYSYLDSVDRVIKAHSYQEYGDSNALEDGLSDSIMRIKDSLERLRE